MTHTNTLREKAEKATRGPWTNNWTGDDPTTVVSSTAVGVLADCGRAVLYSGTVNPQANADFIAAANPSAVIALLDEIDRLREALEALAEAARNSCNAAQHPPLADALFDADQLTPPEKP